LTAPVLAQLDGPLVLAIPSKGRLKEQVEAWLADCGYRLTQDGGARGYSARLEGVADLVVRLASAGDIANAIEAGEVHLGVTGEDLLRERASALEDYGALLAGLGFGRADLVVAVPKSWIDVETMSDLDDVAHALLARSGRRMRVATKYLAQTRNYFQSHGLVDYRIVESSGATEGAPAAGLAEIVVDITTTGATLADNGLKILSDGVILKSEANLTGSLVAPWSPQHRETARNLLLRIEARARGRSHYLIQGIEGPGSADRPLPPALWRYGSEYIVQARSLPAVSEGLADQSQFAGIKAELLYEGTSAPFENLVKKLPNF
jgi:ATP phosphoribosyltransferase